MSDASRGLEKALDVVSAVKIVVESGGATDEERQR